MTRAFKRLADLAVFVLVYAVALLPRRRGAVPPQRVLLVPVGKLGDVVCTTPVLCALRANLPQAKLYVRDSNGVHEKLLADSGLADGFVPLGGLFAYSRALAALRPDAVLITAPAYLDLAAALLARVPTIIVARVEGGFAPQQLWRYRKLWRFVDTFPYRVGQYGPREILGGLTHLGIHTTDTTKHLGYSAGAGAYADAYLAAEGLAGRPFAVISPSSGHEVKNWPAERFAQVAEHVVARGLPVVVIGTTRDAREVGAMMQALHNPTGVHDALGAFPLDELKALIARAALYISADTGPLYIAEAFDVPTIDILGPVARGEQAPEGPRHIVLEPRRAKAELYLMNVRTYDEAEVRRQAQATPVAEVIQAADALIDQYVLTGATHTG